MPRSQQAPTTNAAIFNIKLSLPLMELETSSVMVPVSIGISPLLILSTMVNACSIASVMITMRAIRAESIKIEPRRYFFKTRCPRPGNIRPDRSAAFIDLLISSTLAYGRLPERLPSAISGHSIRAGRRDWFSLEGHTKNATPKASPIQRVTCSAGVLFVQMHKTEASTPPRHDVRSQADRSNRTKFREQRIQTLHGRVRG